MDMSPISSGSCDMALVSKERRVIDRRPSQVGPGRPGVIRTAWLERSELWGCNGL